MDHNRLRLAVGLALMLLLTLNSKANAAIYKCVSANGETTYSQSACPKDSDSSRYSTVGSGNKRPASMDCRLAVKFSEVTGKAMRSGQPSGSVFNRYGGLSSMSGSAVSIVNYVYTFEQNYQTSIERIAGLTRIRCENGSFGDASCQKFPSRFVSEAGGCDLSTSRQSGARDGVEQKTTNCKTNILKKLEAIDETARAGLTASEQNNYRANRQKLRREFDNC